MDAAEVPEAGDLVVIDVVHPGKFCLIWQAFSTLALGQCPLHRGLS